MFEKKSENPSEEEIREKKLTAFRREVAALMEEEKEKERLGKERGNPHLVDPNFNPDDLTEDDVRVWERLENGELTLEEFREYQRNVFETSEDKIDTRHLKEGTPVSRSLFAGFMANRAMGIFFEDESEE